MEFALINILVVQKFRRCRKSHFVNRKLGHFQIYKLKRLSAKQAFIRQF